MGSEMRWSCRLNRWVHPLGCICSTCGGFVLPEKRARMVQLFQNCCLKFCSAGKLRVILSCFLTAVVCGLWRVAVKIFFLFCDIRNVQKLFFFLVGITVLENAVHHYPDSLLVIVIILPSRQDVKDWSYWTINTNDGWISFCWKTQIAVELSQRFVLALLPWASCSAGTVWYWHDVRR